MLSAHGSSENSQVYTASRQHIKAPDDSDLPEENEQGEEEVTEVVASVYHTVLPRHFSGLMQTDFAEQLHPNDGIDEEDDGNQEGYVGQSLAITISWLR